VERPDHGRGGAGRQRLGDRLDKLHRPAQPDAARFKNGKGNAYETPLRDKTHGRIYRLVMKNAGEPRSVRTDCRTSARLRKWSRRSRATISSGGNTRNDCSWSVARRM